MNKLCWYLYIAIRSPWYSSFVSHFEGSWTAVSSEIQDETFPPFGTLQPDVLTPLMFTQRIEPVKLHFKRRRNIRVICSWIYKYKQRLITVHFWISVTGQFKPILITLWTSCLLNEWVAIWTQLLIRQRVDDLERKALDSSFGLNTNIGIQIS